MCELRRHVYANTVDRSTIKKLVRRAFPRCECKKLHQEQQERNARRSGEDAFVDLDDPCGDALDSNTEAELQAVEMQYLEEVEAQSQEQNKQATEKVECNDAAQGINSEKAKEHCNSNSAHKGKGQVNYIQFNSPVCRVNVLMIENVSTVYTSYLHLLGIRCVMSMGQ